MPSNHTATGTLWSANWKEHFQPDAETALWDTMLKDFVLRGLFREFKISFCETKDVLNFNSPVFQRVKLHFRIGQKNPWDCVDLDSKPEWKVKGWWYHSKSGGKLLLSKLANKRGNMFHAIKNTMKGENGTARWSVLLLAPAFHQPYHVCVPHLLLHFLQVGSTAPNSWAKVCPQWSRSARVPLRWMRRLTK